MFDVAGRWEVNYFDEALLNLDGSGTYLNFALYERYPLTWSLENNVLEMTYNNGLGKIKSHKVKIDSVTINYKGREEYRRLHVTPLGDCGLRDRWKELKDF